VSYVLASQPMGASDPVGVFVQCPGAEGPALFLAVDPTTLSPAPTVGDVVSFDVTSAVDVASGAGSTGDQHRVTGLSGYTRTATGMSLAPTDLSGIDLPAMIDAHESELVTITGTIAAAATPRGGGIHVVPDHHHGLPDGGRDAPRTHALGDRGWPHTQPGSRLHDRARSHSALALHHDGTALRLAGE
jgi:hypothetical protein